MCVCIHNVSEHLLFTTPKTKLTPNHHGLCPLSFDSRSEWAKAKPARGTGVRLQWDPCHDPLGHKHPARRAIQLGLAASVVATLWNTRECILGIQDITAFVAAQKRKIDAGTWRTDGGFVTPTEKPYPLSASLAARICTSTVSLQDARAVKLSVRERENASRKKKKKVPRMHVCEPYLHFLASGVKTHEGRVFKGTWRTLQPGDVIVFFNEEGKTPGAGAGLAFRVTELRRYSDFDKAFEDLGKKLVPEGAETPAEAVEVYRQFNPKSVVDANDGVVCVGVTLLKEGSEGVQSSVASEVDGVDASDST